MIQETRLLFRMLEPEIVASRDASLSPDFFVERHVGPREADLQDMLRVIGCGSLQELFAALKQDHDDLCLAEFHNGLRRLQDGKLLRLLPFSDPPEKLPEPEYALLDGGAVLYYVEK